MKNKQKGFTLIECIVSIALISMIMISISLILSFALNSYGRHTDDWQTKHDVYIASKYIEKSLREFNQEDIIFDGDNNIFQGKDYDNKSAWVYLSGKRPFKTNILIYFYDDTKEIRVNKNNENNVLCGNIGNVTVNELIEGKLIEIEVTAYKTGYSVKTRLNLNYRKK